MTLHFKPDMDLNMICIRQFCVVIAVTCIAATSIRKDVFNGSGTLEPGIYVRTHESVCPDDALVNWHLA